MTLSLVYINNALSQSIHTVYYDRSPNYITESLKNSYKEYLALYYALDVGQNEFETSVQYAQRRDLILNDKNRKADEIYKNYFGDYLSFKNVSLNLPRYIMDERKFRFDYRIAFTQRDFFTFDYMRIHFFVNDEILYNFRDNSRVGAVELTGERRGADIQAIFRFHTYISPDKAMNLRQLSDSNNLRINYLFEIKPIPPRSAKITAINLTLVGAEIIDGSNNILYTFGQSRDDSGLGPPFPVTINSKRYDDFRLLDEYSVARIDFNDIRSLSIQDLKFRDVRSVGTAPRQVVTAYVLRITKKDGTTTVVEVQHPQHHYRLNTIFQTNEGYIMLKKADRVIFN